jgi:hypothetical protein
MGGGRPDGTDPRGKHLIEPTVVCAGLTDIDFSRLVVADVDTPEVSDALAGGRCRLRPHQASDGGLYWYDTNASGFR